jgi:DICT domain-containing protein
MSEDAKKGTLVTVPEIDPQDVKEASDLVDIANDWTIDSEDVRSLADKDLARIKAHRKHLDTQRTFLKAPALEAGRRIDGMFNPRIGECEEAEKILTRKILDYDRKLAAERAEQQRIANEAAEQQRLALVTQLNDAAQMVSAAPVALVVSTYARSTAKRELWSAELTDLKALAKAVVEGRVPEMAISANMTYLNGRARQEKDKLNIDGVKAVGEETLAAKRAASA